MSVQSADVNVQPIWGSFEEVRDHLFHQYHDPGYDSDTGLSLQELEDEVGSGLRAHGGRVRCFQTDVSDEAQVNEMVEETIQELTIYKPLIDYLSKCTGKKIEFYMPTSYSTVVEAMTRHRLI